MTKVYTLALWGNLQPNKGWVDWFRFMEDSSKLFGSPLTHFGIKGDGLGTKDIRSIDKFSKVRNVIETSKVEWLSGYSLPKDFQTAVFDYNVHMNLCSSYVSISVKESYAASLLSDSDDWMQKATRFCLFRNGMLFQMDENESPLLYVSGSSSQKSFSSMSVIKEFH